jgi:hypothetical protein
MDKKNPKNPKPENPKVVKKSKVESTSDRTPLEKSESQEITGNINSAIDIPHSEIKNKSEIELTTHNSPLTNMEVHHHPDVEKKGLKEYILEGLMIFLAVTMGFFAETIREGISDNAKAKEYIKSFVHDLRADTATLSTVKAFDEKKVSRLNGQFACFDSISNNRGPASCLIILVKNSTFNIKADFSDGTLQQLKNAGGFRLLNSEDKDSIVAYDIAERDFADFQSTVFQQQQDNIRNTYNDAGNYKANFMLFPDSGKKANFMSLPDSGKSYMNVPVLFSGDKAALNKYFNNLFTYRRVFIGHINQIRKIKKQATVLIKYFENKYNLEK